MQRSLHDRPTVGVALWREYHSPKDETFGQRQTRLIDKVAHHFALACIMTAGRPVYFETRYSQSMKGSLPGLAERYSSTEQGYSPLIAGG